MLVFLLVILMIIFNGIAVRGKNEFFGDYISRKSTTAINGIFAILIFLSHVIQYVKLGGPLDEPYLTFKGHISQLVVVTFLFYSGFGMMESIRNKGNAYVREMPKNRFLKLWTHFAFAIILYIIMGFVFKRGFSLSKTLLAFTGYTSVGNSNWYMFVTFAMYIIIYVSFMLIRKSKVAAVVLVTVLSMGFAYFEKSLGLPNFYYNTVLCMPTGMVFSLIRPYFEKLVMKNDFTWMLAFTAAVAIYFYTFKKRAFFWDLGYVAWTFAALLVIILFTMKVKISNDILDWFGKHVFEIYILQRIPMFSLSKLGILSGNKYGFIIASFVLTIFLTYFFDFVTERLDKVLFKKNSGGENGKKKTVVAG